MTNYPVVIFGVLIWKILDNDLMTVTEEFGAIKLSMVVIYNLFIDPKSNVTANGSTLLKLVDEIESKRTTTFLSGIGARLFHSSC